MAAFLSREFAFNRVFPSNFAGCNKNTSSLILPWKTDEVFHNGYFSDHLASVERKMQE